MLKINDLRTGDTQDIFLLVSSISEKVASNKNTYVEFVFEDGITKIGGKKWSTTINQLPGITVGSIVKVRATVSEWNNAKQVVVQQCRAVVEKDNVDIDEFIRKAPIQAEKMLDFMINIVNDFSNEHIKRLTLEPLIRYRKELLYFPGAMLVHHNIKSGLLYHMYRMLQAGINMAEIYPGINTDLLFSGIILHDIGKIFELCSDESGKVQDYTNEGKLLGHTVQGIKIVTKLSIELGIPEEVSVLIEHMIASHHGDESKGAIKKPMFLEAELLHNLDAIDSRVYMINEINDNLEDNSFSDKQFFLNNSRIFKHKL